MRSTLAICLALVLSSSFFFKVGAIAWYGINKSEIVKQLCLEKDLEKNTCQGNCELNKTLSLSETPTQDQEPEFTGSIEVLNFIVPEDSLETYSNFGLEIDFIPYNQGETKGFKQPIIRPPILS